LKILAVVPARGGSKRLPNKNIKILGGKPLIQWTLESVDQMPEICDLLVSTDDLKIAEIALGFGVMAPWLRPSYLATDLASSVDVVLHALDWYEDEYGPVDGVLLLQPTTPFRSKSKIRVGIDLFSSSKFKSVVGVSESQSHPMWTFMIEGGELVPFCEGKNHNTRSQDLKPAFVINGGFYLISPHELRAKKSFINEETLPLIISSPIEAIDIDTQWDFDVAEFATKHANLIG